jgi:hypothetical protein
MNSSNSCMPCTAITQSSAAAACITLPPCHNHASLGNCRRCCITPCYCCCHLWEGCGTSHVILPVCCKATVRRHRHEAGTRGCSSAQGRDNRGISNVKLHIRKCCAANLGSRIRQIRCVTCACATFGTEQLRATDAIPAVHVMTLPGTMPRNLLHCMQETAGKCIEKQQQQQHLRANSSGVSGIHGGLLPPLLIASLAAAPDTPGTPPEARCCSCSCSCIAIAFNSSALFMLVSCCSCSVSCTLTAS